MIPLLLFLLAVGAVYVGTIETAFSALMKLSLRLMAERGGRDDRLGFYLDDPIQLFVPARLLLGIIFSIATVLLAVVTGRWGVNLRAIGLLLLCVTAYMLVCEHLLPLVIVRRDPERVLELLLPREDLRLVNVNFPQDPVELRWTRQAVTHYDGRVLPGQDPMGRKHYWIAPGRVEDVAEGTDRWAIRNRFVALTPLRVDLTDDAALAALLETAGR
jgi:hypothetical protein